MSLWPRLRQRALAIRHDDPLLYYSFAAFNLVYVSAVAALWFVGLTSKGLTLVSVAQLLVTAPLMVAAGAARGPGTRKVLTFTAGTSGVVGLALTCLFLGVWPLLLGFVFLVVVASFLGDMRFALYEATLCSLAFGVVLYLETHPALPWRPIFSYANDPSAYSLTYMAMAWGIITLLLFGLGVVLTTLVQQRAKLGTFLERFVPRDAIVLALRSPAAGGKADVVGRASVAILFGDLVGFTDASDSIEPEQLSMMLNEFYSEAAQVIESAGGQVAKFIGDAVLAFFDAPDDLAETASVACVKASLALQQSARALQARWRSKGIERPFELRVGINQGYVLRGTFGSGTRAEYTILGRQVNIAARLQSVCEPGRILISGSVAPLVEARTELERVGDVHLKGIARPVAAYYVTRMRDS